jgi:hypothetical protein
MVSLHEFLVKFLLPLCSVVAGITPFFVKLNKLENRGLELIRKINQELTPIITHEKTRLEHKIQIALLKQRVNDLEGFLIKQGFIPSDIDENSFL